MKSRLQYLDRVAASHRCAILLTTLLLTFGCGSGGGGGGNGVVEDDPPPDAPTVSLTATPLEVIDGNRTSLNWTSANTDSCIASGAWTGNRATKGSENSGILTNPTNTFTIICAGPGGNAEDSVTVTTITTGAITGLDFQGNSGVAGASNTVRFRFTNPLDIFPATYIWHAYPRQQNGYYTTFFWGNDDGQNNLNTFLWTSTGGADSYYGAHPYPDPPPGGSEHNWEVSVEQQDFQNGRVVYDRWYTQALRVYIDPDSRKQHEFYWDLPSTAADRRVIRNSPATWGNVDPPVPTLTWGDAPWAPGNEIYDGIIRGIQIYSTSLSLSEIQQEIDAPLSTQNGAANIWYLNLNPTVDDISDKSGKDNHPEWVGNKRPQLWTGP